ncbi:MAG TPA: CocE/NonD family hydrolase [Steroidobacteraceae bacterium]|nr:CocE/NonD family hydrolase [Steroidobacteraceae bacterium]
MSKTADKRGVRVQWGETIPLRDGVRLSATLYLPEGMSGPAPALCTLTPYIGQTYHERGLYFAAHGYPFLTVDVRGRGNSEGVFVPNINEAKDGCDVVEWLASQPYCNGKVAMWGGSYAGYSQWAVAKEFPVHLATIVPAAAPCFGVDFPIRSNVASPYLLQWLSLVAGKTLQDDVFADRPYWSGRFRRWLQSGIAFNSLDRFLGAPSTIFQDWLAHPHQDAHWDRYNPTPEQYAQLTLPILTITGIYDGNQLGALTHYREHCKHSSASARARHYLVIGPWDHAGTRTPTLEFAGLCVGPESLVDLPALHREWYAWTMQDGPKPAFLEKNVAFYVMGLEQWRYADTLEAVTAGVRPLYLQSVMNPIDVFSSGSLSGKPQGGPDRYVYDPRDTSLAELEASAPEGPTNDQLVYASTGRHLVYHSDAFVDDVEICGFFRLSVWLAIDQPDTDFRAAVYAVDIDGSTVELSADWMRARYRESLREEHLVRTTAPLRYDFERFTFVARQVRKGSRLRLVIGPINSIYRQKNYNSGRDVSGETMQDARPVTVQLFHDAEHPSVLDVPLGSLLT